MLDPPGTMRTPLVDVNRFTGQVALSKKGCRVASIDISTIPPIRKPNKIPFFTHAFTRQPVAVELSGLGCTNCTRVQGFFDRANSSKCSSVQDADFWSKTASILVCMRAPRRRKAADDFRTASILARFASEGGTIGKRNTGSSSPIMAHRGFHRTGINFAEVYFQQRNHSRCTARAPAKSASQCELRKLGHFRRNLIRCDRNQHHVHLVR